MTTPNLRGPEQLPGVSRETAIHLAETLAQLYGVMEERLVEQMAMMLRRGIDSPDWADRKRAELGRLRQWIRVLLLRLQRDSSREVTYAVLRAYLLGGEEALRGLAAAQNTLPEWVTTAGITPGPQIEALLAAKNADLAVGLAALAREFPGLAAVQHVARSLALNVDGTHLRVLRWAEDAYKTVIATEALPQVLMGLKTRRQASQQAWARLIGDGVTGFVDKRGRHWNLATYVEMATRTGVAQAAVEGHMDRLADRGLDLVIVSDVAQECALCRPWEGKVLSRTQSGARTVDLEHATVDGRTVSVHIAGSIAQAVAAGLMHPNCFPAEVLVSAPSGVVAADARRYEGPLVVIHTAGGDELPVTPNHPVLTPEGWVAAGDLKVGQRVLRYRGDVEGAALGAPDDQQVPARIGDVFDALRQASPVAPFRVPVAAEQFHGDGLGSDVDVVLADGLLGHGIGDQPGDREFVGGGVGTSPLLPDSTALQVAEGAGHASHGLMRGSNLNGALLCRHGRPLAGLGVAAADLGASLEDPATDARLRDIERGRELVLTLAGLVSADEVVDVELREASCHVYNLQTGDGWYVANGLVVSNCRHSLNAYFPGLTRAPRHTEDPDGDAARRQLRYLERGVRHWKLQAIGALTPEAKASATAKVRQWQGRIRDHVAASEHLAIRRHREREQINLGHKV